MMSIPMTVLLLDDHDSHRRNLKVLLEDEGFRVFEAESGEVALQVMYSVAIDVVIVDIRLPSMSGGKFVEIAHASYPDLCFVIYTGSSNYLLSNELRHIGLTDDDVFIKPLSDPAALFTRLRDLGGI
ncbi:MAG: response regulator [Gallionella sp.]|nr:response regulator [Gallionella sp.]